MAGIKITAVDLENGDREEMEIQPGQYNLVCADPLYLDGVVRYPNGTIVLTIKRKTEPAHER